MQCLCCCGLCVHKLTILTVFDNNLHNIGNSNDVELLTGDTRSCILSKVAYLFLQVSDQLLNLLLTGWYMKGTHASINDVEQLSVLAEETIAIGLDSSRLSQCNQLTMFR